MSSIILQGLDTSSFLTEGFGASAQISDLVYTFTANFTDALTFQANFTQTHQD